MAPLRLISRDTRSNEHQQMDRTCNQPSDRTRKVASLLPHSIWGGIFISRKWFMAPLRLISRDTRSNEHQHMDRLCNQPSNRTRKVASLLPHSIWGGTSISTKWSIWSSFTPCSGRESSIDPKIGFRVSAIQPGIIYALPSHSTAYLHITWRYESLRSRIKPLLSGTS